jgi:outer membrane protein OmpA-like peptidoglycan-associated protein
LLHTSANANVIGSDAQNFNPSTSGLDFVTVHSSETLEPGIVNFGFFINHAVNTLPYFPNLTGGSSQSRNDFNNSFTAGDLNVGLGLMPNWDVGLSFPVLLAQNVDNTNGLGLYKEGLTEIRLNTKYRLLGNNDQGLALIGSTNMNRIKNNPFSGQDPGPTVNFEIAGDKTFGKWAIGLNLGYRFRSPGSAIPGIPIDPIANQGLVSIATSYLLADLDTKLIFEIYSAFPESVTGTNQTDRDLSSIEFIGGAKHDLQNNLALHFGGGTELNQGSSAPDWRLYAGLNWNLGPLWAKESKLRVEKVEKKIQVDLAGLNFKIGTAQLTTESQETIKQMISKLDLLNQQYSINRIEVAGHTDSVGSNKVNQELSQYRADTIRNIIIERTTLTAEQVKAVGYGEDRPIADNGNYQGRARNRRVELRLDTDN